MRVGIVRRAAAGRRTGRRRAPAGRPSRAPPARAARRASGRARRTRARRAAPRPPRRRATARPPPRARTVTRRARRQREPEGARVQVVVDGVEPALAPRAARPKPQIPLVRRRGRGAARRARRMAGAPVEGGDARARAGLASTAICQPPAWRARVKVAVVHQRLQGERGGRAAAQQRVAHVGRVGARLHPDALLDLGVGARERPHRRGAVEAEALDQPVAVRVRASRRPSDWRRAPTRRPSYSTVSSSLATRSVRPTGGFSAATSSP